MRARLPWRSLTSTGQTFALNFRLAKRLLEAKGLRYTELQVGLASKPRTEMERRSGGRPSVSQIFVEGLHIAGFDDPSGLDRTERLDRSFGLAADGGTQMTDSLHIACPGGAGGNVQGDRMMAGEPCSHSCNLLFSGRPVTSGGPTFEKQVYPDEFRVPANFWADWRMFCRIHAVQKAAREFDPMSGRARSARSGSRRAWCA